METFNRKESSNNNRDDNLDYSIIIIIKMADAKSVASEIWEREKDKWNELLMSKLTDEEKKYVHSIEVEYKGIKPANEVDCKDNAELLDAWSISPLFQTHGHTLTPVAMTAICNRIRDIFYREMGVKTSILAARRKALQLHRSSR